MGRKMFYTEKNFCCLFIIFFFLYYNFNFVVERWDQMSLTAKRKVIHNFAFLVLV